MQPLFEAENDFIFLLIPKEKDSESKGPDKINRPEFSGITSAITLLSLSSVILIKGKSI